MIIQPTRRHFLLGASAAIAAPLIVRPQSLMQIRGTILRPDDVELWRVQPVNWALPLALASADIDIRGFGQDVFLKTDGMGNPIFKRIVS